MSDRWAVALQMDCIDEIRALRRTEQEFVARSLDWLSDNATHPLYMVEGKWNFHDIRVWNAGRFLISYWLDHSRKEVRVLRVERTRFIGG